MAIITNESATTTRIVWLTSNESATQLTTTSYGLHAA